MLCYAKLTSVKRNACAKKCWLTLLKQTSPARSTQAFIVSSIMQIFFQILCRNRGKTGSLPRLRRSFANFFPSSKQTKKKNSKHMIMKSCSMQMTASFCSSCSRPITLVWQFEPYHKPWTRIEPRATARRQLTVGCRICCQLYCFKKLSNQIWPRSRTGLTFGDLFFPYVCLGRWCRRTFLPTCKTRDGGDLGVKLLTPVRSVAAAAAAKSGQITWAKQQTNVDPISEFLWILDKHKIFARTVQGFKCGRVMNDGVDMFDSFKRFRNAIDQISI